MSSVRKTFEVLFDARGPSFCKLGTLGLGREVVADGELAILLALEIDQGNRQWDFLLLEHL